MEIVRKEELIKKVSEYKLTPIEIKVLKVADQIFLGIEELEEFLKFANTYRSEYIYYYYTYYNSGKYIIPEEEYSDEYEKQLKTEIRQYNKQIMKLDFGSPKSLTLFVLQNGTFVGIELYFPWLDIKGIEEAEYASDEIESKFHFEVKKARTKKKDQKKEDENKLREIILNDPEFALHSKNQDLRYWYLADVLDTEGMEQFRYLVTPYGIPHTGKAKVFMDITYELYKKRNKKKK
jgi:hypothetical protein